MNAATLFGNAGRPRDALAQARLAWQPTADVGVGTVLVQAAAAAGELDEARRTLDEMLARTAPGDANTRAQIEALRAQLPAASPAPDPAD
jgi:ATP/maltotriose-dependent transcriptional regulator MalT